MVEGPGGAGGVAFVDGGVAEIDLADYDLGVRAIRERRARGEAQDAVVERVGDENLAGGRVDGAAAGDVHAGGRSDDGGRGRCEVRLPEHEIRGGEGADLRGMAGGGKSGCEREGEAVELHGREWLKSICRIAKSGGSRRFQAPSVATPLGFV